MGHPQSGVDHQQGHVRAVDGPEGPHERVVLGVLVDPGLAAHPGCVDEPDGPVIGLHHGVHGVAGGARPIVDDGPLLAGQPVEQRRLSHVGAPDKGHPHDPLAVPLVNLVTVVDLGQSDYEAVQQIAGPATV